MTTSLLEQLRARPGGPDALEALLASLSTEQREQLAHDPRLLGRPCQLPPPGTWRTWVFLAGRGSGKSWAGGQRIRTLVESGRACRVALVGATAADCRDVLLEGPSGLLRLSPPAWRPVYEPSKRKVTWRNGATALLLSAEEPERARGPQFDAAWADEVGAWAGGGEEMWDNLEFAVRLGEHPTIVATTTPRPTRLVRRLLSEPGTAVSRSTTYDNRSHLAASYLEAIERMYGSSRLGRQEILGQLLDDNPEALWRLADIDAARVKAAPELRRICIGVDPAVSSNADSDETGIVVAGIGDCACRGTADRHAFVLDDVSGVMTPAAWARAVQSAYNRWQASRVIAEVNQGGALVEANLRASGAQNLPLRTVHASKGKAIRAEPIAALYEQGKVHHVGFHAKLEDQMVQWSPLADSSSPDRVDALVWVLTELMLKGVGVVSLTHREGPLRPRRDYKPPGWGWDGR